jgi:hypothetical protein
MLPNISEMVRIYTSVILQSIFIQSAIRVAVETAFVSQLEYFPLYLDTHKCRGDIQAVVYFYQFNRNFLTILLQVLRVLLIISIIPIVTYRKNRRKLTGIFFLWEIG